MRDNSIKKVFFENLKKMSSHLDRYAECLSKNKSKCIGRPIGAHTISRKYLQRIAESNHILIPEIDHSRNLPFKLSSCSINKATTFSGFCQTHDNNIFKPIEVEEYNAFDTNHIYLQSLRVIAREYFQKKALNNMYKKLLNEDLKVSDVTGYVSSQEFKAKISQANRECRDHKFLYEHLKGGNIIYINFIYSGYLPILSSGVYFPLFGLDGNRLQNEKYKQHGFIYYALPFQVDGYDFTSLVLSTTKCLNKNTDRIFLESLYYRSEEYFLDFMIRMFFLNNDCIVINPSFGASLHPDILQEIEGIWKSNIGKTSEAKLVTLGSFYGLLNNKLIKKTSYFSGYYRKK